MLESIFEKIFKVFGSQSEAMLAAKSIKNRSLYWKRSRAASKMSQKRSQDVPKKLQDAARTAQWAAPGRARRPQDAAKTVVLANAAKTPLRSSWRRRPRHSQDLGGRRDAAKTPPRRHQHGPRRFQDGPRRPKMAQDASKTAQESSKNG